MRLVRYSPLDKTLHPVYTSRQIVQTASALTAGAYILLPAGEEHFGFRPSESSLSYLWAHFRTKQGFEPVQADDHLEF